MEKMLAKSREGNSGSTVTSKPTKAKKPKIKKSVLQLSMELIPDGKYAGLLEILEPYELGLEK